MFLVMSCDELEVDVAGSDFSCFPASVDESAAGAESGFLKIEQF